MLSYKELVSRCKGDKLGWCVDLKQRHSASEVIIETCHTILPVITKNLNAIHGVNYSQRYWHILLGPWLYHFCCIVYDRKRLLAYSTEDDILKVDSRIVPRDSYESTQLSDNSDFNQQLLSDILLGCDSIDDCSFNSIEPCNNYKFDYSYLKAFAFNYISGLLTTNKSITVSLTAMPLMFQFKVFYYFSGIRPLKALRDDYKLYSCSITLPMRLKLRAKPTEDRFLNLIQSLLPYYIPICFVEGYETLNQLGKRYISKPRAILSTTETYYGYESYKHWLAKCSEAGTIILNLQHGGNYGLSWTSGKSFIERAPSDVFYSWGWKHPTYRLDGSEVEPMPILKHFYGDERNAALQNDSQRIVFASTSMRTYLREFGGVPDDPYNRDRYLFNQFSFYEQLPQNLKESFYIRVGELKKSNYMKNYKEAWKEKYPSVLFDNRDINFRTSVRQCKLFIVDHLSTTWLEALIIGVPTIIFIDKDQYDFTAEFQEVISMLHSVSILHYSTESAAKEVSAINYDVSAWWRDRHRANILQKALNKIVVKSEHLAFDWSKELKKVSKKKCYPTARNSLFQ
ncbi:LIC12162 family protein [Amylibacter sp.]|nr:LIC12162 family protein [Amylibacter sp.]